MGRTFSMDEADNWRGGESVPINKKNKKIQKRKGQKMSRQQNSMARGGCCSVADSGFGGGRDAKNK